MSDDGDGRADEFVPDGGDEDDDSPGRAVDDAGASASDAGAPASDDPAAPASGDAADDDGSDAPASGDAASEGDDGDAASDGDAAAPGELRGHAENLEERVDALLEEARDARAAFEPPDDPEERALTYCREGLWPVLAVYVDRRGARAALGQPHHDRLERALNTWLELYARCYGAEIDAAFSVREAAELFVSTHNVVDVAQLLTDVPDRRAGGTAGR